MPLQPWQPNQPWQGGHGGQSGMRASHADRERAVDVLKAAFAEGRLTPQEYEDRVGRAYKSSTYGELGVLVGDLPQGPVPFTFQGRPLVPQPYPQPYMPLPLPPPPRPTNSYAIGALVCGLAVPFGGLTAVPAVILGHTAKSQLKRSGEEGDGLANVGLVFGWMGIIFWSWILLLVIT